MGKRVGSKVAPLSPLSGLPQWNNQLRKGVLMIENTAAQDTMDVPDLNSMIRGEMAAVETYNQASKNVKSAGVAAELEKIRDRHQGAVCALRHWVRELRESPSPHSGVWGYFTAALTGLAALVGERGMITALRQGERHGEALYRSGMGNADLPDEFRFLLGSKLLPQCLEHLGRLDRLASEA